MEFESREFRNILGAFATGVVIITTGNDPMFHGMTAQSFSSLSLDPPLVLVCVYKGASMVDFLNESKSFTVNVLGASQEDAMWYFASKDRPAPKPPPGHPPDHRTPGQKYTHPPAIVSSTGAGAGERWAPPLGGVCRASHPPPDD